MECKFPIASGIFESTFRINRYIMECKLIQHTRDYFIKYELIDTLWNVNDDCIKQKPCVLRGINRYIIECKFVRSNARARSDSGN